MSQAAPWTICPRPNSNELLSSYLVRIAYANGMSPLRFCAFHFPKMPIWNRDLDRNATTTFVSSVALRSQARETEIRDMTLQEWETILAPLPSARQSVRPALAHWINALGIYHRSRTRYGMQYCPSCLAEADFYRKEWRLSFVTLCERHACSLLDCCVYCQAPIAPHCNETLHLHCHRCGHSLLSPVRRTEDVPEFSIRLMLQQRLLAALMGGKSDVANVVVPAISFFLGLSLLLRTVKERLRVLRRHHQALPLLVTSPFGPMETLRLDGRVQQCLAMAQLLDDWPCQFLSLAQDIRLTQRAFDGPTSLPEWLDKIVEQLPTGRAHFRRKHACPVRLELRRIHRHKAPDWRTRRARLLLKKARA